MCGRCHCLYNVEDCYELIGRRRSPGHVILRSFHYVLNFITRRPCSQALWKAVMLSSVREVLVPNKYYCYRSVVSTLKEYLLRPGFAEACEELRERQVAENTLAHVYDSRIWKQSQYVNGAPFVAGERSYAFMLNVDWFQPFNHTPYSVRVTYMVLLNLPRNQRFLKKNLFVVGIIPGPYVSSLTINSYLESLVDELEHLWQTGECFKSSRSIRFAERYRAALVCVTCDIPASRKVGGFLGHDLL